jgi:hypothetical protein
MPDIDLAARARELIAVHGIHGAAVALGCTDYIIMSCAAGGKISNTTRIALVALFSRLEPQKEKAS